MCDLYIRNVSRVFPVPASRVSLVAHALAGRLVASVLRSAVTVAQTGSTVFRVGAELFRIGIVSRIALLAVSTGRVVSASHAEEFPPDRLAPVRMSDVRDFSYST